MSCPQGFTAVDLVHAMAYAKQQVAYLKCQDPDIVSNICNGNPTGNMPAGGGTCIKWIQDDSQAFYPKPNNYYRRTCNKDSDCYVGKCIDGNCSCKQDSDCGGLNCISDPNNQQNLICGYSPSYVAAGHCIFTNEQSCLSQSQLPWNCTSCGPQGRDPGKCVTVSGADGKTGPQFPYLEWHTDDKGNGKCVLGNFPLRQWCEYPCSRCMADSNGNRPPMCNSGADTPGVSDVPPFYYDANKGNCYMTHDYCSHYGLNYTMGTCTKDSDCGKGNYCDMRSGTGRCTGPDAKCYESEGQKIAEFFIGRTLFYILKKKGCKEKFTQNYDYDSELKEINSNISESLNKTPETVCSLWKPNNIKTEKMLMKDFGGQGINLYLFELKEPKNKLVTSFKPNEIEKNYPTNVERHPDGTVLICISRNELKNKKDKFLQRIYLSLGSSSWLTQSMILASKLNQKSL